MKPYLILAIFILITACTPQQAEDGRLSVVSTTGMINDIVINVGGAHVRAQSLMGPGTDPHLYQASEGDVRRISGADLVFYNGLHLEAKMGEILGAMPQAHAVSDGIEPRLLIEASGFGGTHDPHIWFDVSLWQKATLIVRDELIRKDPDNAAEYQENARAYVERLDTLDDYARERIQSIPEDQRILVTAHDAFNYFGAAYGIEVVGLQGISTASEAGTRDVQELADMVAERKIKAIFVETSVPERTIQAVQQAVAARGFEVEIGGSLFSDAMGDANTPQGTYEGMVRANVDTIVGALG